MKDRREMAASISVQEKIGVSIVVVIAPRNSAEGTLPDQPCVAIVYPSATLIRTSDSKNRVALSVNEDVESAVVVIIREDPLAREKSFKGGRDRCERDRVLMKTD